MLSFILLQASPSPDGGDTGFGNFQWIFFGAIILIFYFFMIRPQQKKQKSQKDFIASINKGDMVVTIGGIHGKVLSTEDQQITLEIDRGVKIKIDKTSVSLESSKRYAKDGSSRK